MEHVTEILALVLVVGLAAQWIGWRLGIPAIVLLILFGLLVGPMSGFVHPREALGEAFQPLIKLGVAAILFEGGLALRWHELRQAAAGVNRLISVGMVLSLAFGATAAHFIGGLSWPVAIVFGTIIVVTGPTVILPLLRQARLKRRPASYIKWEGIVNDPIGALLATVAFQYFASRGETSIAESLLHLALGFAGTTALGAGLGWLLGRAYLEGLAPEYLKGPLALAAALGAYALANLVLEEAGLVAATVMGVMLGNMGLPSIGEIRRFKEYVAILLVSGIFMLLTADLDPLILLPLDWRGVALVAAIVFLVRPAAVALATIGAGMSWQERVLVGWIAPRGVVAAAVAGIFGPSLAAHGYAGAGTLLPLVFTLILVTVIVHGFSLRWVARLLGLSAPKEGGLLISGANAWSTGLAEALHTHARCPWSWPIPPGTGCGPPGLLASLSTSGSCCRKRPRARSSWARWETCSRQRATMPTTPWSARTSRPSSGASGSFSWPQASGRSAAARPRGHGAAPPSGRRFNSRTWSVTGIRARAFRARASQRSTMPTSSWRVFRKTPCHCSSSHQKEPFRSWRLDGSLGPYPGIRCSGSAARTCVLRAWRRTRYMPSSGPWCSRLLRCRPIPASGNQPPRPG
jgi:NhaP-type Na+/H+ or K+/H+ antiporter